MALCREFININVQLCIRGEFVIRCLVVLMAFYPLNADRSSELVMEFTNYRKEVIIVRLFGRPVVFSHCEDHAIDGDLTVHYPAEFAAVSESPVSCYQGDE